MSSMKRVPLAVLFLIAAALLAGTPAIARDVEVIPLLPVGDESTASGKATLSNLEVTWANPGAMEAYYQGRVRVTCAGLTPGAMYEVWTNQWHPGGWVLGDFQASGRGTGAAGGWVGWSVWTSPLSVLVVRVDENADGTFVYTTVLAGSFPF